MVVGQVPTGCPRPPAPFGPTRFPLHPSLLRSTLPAAGGCIQQSALCWSNPEAIYVTAATMSAHVTREFVFYFKQSTYFSDYVS